MAVYEAAQSWAVASETCKITRTESKDGITVYIVEVTVSPYTWQVKRRYSEFRHLHQQLTKTHHIDKTLLPPRKWLGCQSELFIAKRQADLQLYLQTLIHQFSLLPSLLATFLDFHRYEVRSIIGKLAELLYYQGDSILQGTQAFQFSPLELYAISERLKLAEPTFSDGSKVRDIGHILSFISELKHLIIFGKNEAIGTSNIVPNHLPFNLTFFKKLQSLEIASCDLNDHLQSIEPINKTLERLSVHDTLKDISSITLCGIIHWDPHDYESRVSCWNFVTVLNLSHNFLSSIHPSMKLFPSVESLDLSYNSIEEIENLDCLSNLSYLNLSYNNIQHIKALHTRLGNIRCLILNGNMVECLQGVSRMFSLGQLELQNNQIASLLEVENLGKLPCLEKVKLANNPVCDFIDYRTQVLKLFGTRVHELTLDGIRPSEKETDTVSVIQALEASQQNCNPQESKTTMADKGVSALCHHSYCGLQCSQGLSIKSDSLEYREQVITLRKLGGTNWLSLLNQMQSNPKQEAVMHLKTDNRPRSPQVNNSFCVKSNPSINTHAFQGSHNDFLSCDFVFPEWFLEMGARDQSTIDYFQSVIEIGSFKEVPVTPVCSLEDFLWATYFLEQSITVSLIPVCILMFSSQIIILKINNFAEILYSSTNVNLSYFVPQMCFLKILLPANILSLTAGPRKSYLEIHLNSSSGIQKHVFLMPNSTIASIYIEKFVHLYKLVISFNESPFVQEVLNLEKLNSDKTPFRGPVIQCQILFCERVILLQTLGSCNLSDIHYVTVTPSHLILIEEKINTMQFPSIHYQQYSRFRACTVINVRTNVNNVYMGSDCDDFIKPQETFQKIVPDHSLSKELIQKMHSCSPWLFIEFECGVIIKIIFLCFQDRNNFLDAFLCARTIQ